MVPVVTDAVQERTRDGRERYTLLRGAKVISELVHLTSRGQYPLMPDAGSCVFVEVETGASTSPSASAAAIFSRSRGRSLALLGAAVAERAISAASWTTEEWISGVSPIRVGGSLTEPNEPA